MELNAPRIRFNWGFWDGRNAAQAGQRKPLWKSPHFDAVYEAGHDAGRASAQEAVESSDAAWKAHKASQASRAAARKASREARPEPQRRF